MEGFDNLMVVLGSILIIMLIILIPIIIFEIIATWKFYQKCGRKGWECIIPFYNSWILTEIAGLNWWWFLLLVASPTVKILFSDAESISLIISLVNIFASFVCYYNIAKKFHKDTGFAVLMTLFPGIAIPIMAFSKNYVYDASVEVSKNGIFDSNNTNTTNNTNTNYNTKYCPNCGNPVNPNEKFCGNCGKEIN